MKLFGSPVATAVGYGHFHRVPATFLYMLRVEFADQIAADGIGLTEQSVFPLSFRGNCLFRFLYPWP